MKNKEDMAIKRPHIGLQMIIKMAVANLKFKRFRSMVTILGVIIGIGSVFLLISFGLGLQSLVQGEIVGNKSIDTVDVTSADATIIRLTPDNIDKIKAIPHVTSTSGLYMLAGQVTLDGSSVDLVAYGVDSLYLELSALHPTTGTYVDAEKTDELVISRSLLDALGVEDEASVINKQMNVKFTPQGGNAVDKNMRVVGVVNLSSGLEIFMSQKVFREANASDFTQAKVTVESREFIADVRRGIESFGFDTTSPVDTLDQVNEVFRFFNLILVGLGGVGLVIAVLGMINTLTVSLLERTREIALMMAIGARPKDMRRLFTIEAMLLSLVGGIIGIILASGLGSVINLLLNQFASDRGITYGFSVFSAPPLLVVGMLVLMVFIGVIVSYVPAKRAARINPIEALHQE